MNELISKYKNLNLPGKLIVIQIALWVASQIGRLVHFPWEHWFSLSSNPEALLSKPWSLFSYMWFHANLGIDLFHIVFNMIWLWYFGTFFMYYHTKKQFLTLYILGGIVGGIAFLLFGDGYLVGASGAIFALVAAAAIRQPDYPIYLNFFVKVVPIKMKWFALIALGLNLMNLHEGTNAGGIICHLGGMLFGILYELNLLFGWTRSLFQSKPRMQASQGGKRTPHPDQQKDFDYNKRKREHQEKIDAILDKISRSGYDGLTTEEKAILFDASQRKKNP